jgi:hypothetical protein
MRCSSRVTCVLIYQKPPIFYAGFAAANSRKAAFVSESRQPLKSGAYASLRNRVAVL